MNYEQKYKDALERARKELQEFKNKDCDDTTRRTAINVIYNLFPELKESDELIRNFLIDFIKVCRWTDKEDQGWPLREECIAWLKKQGEKSTIIDVDKMVMEYSQTRDGDFGLPVNCMIKAYKKGINDALKLSLNLEKQGEQIELKKVEQDNHPRIVMADFNGGEGFYKLHLDNLNKEQVDAIEILLTNSN